MGRPLSNLFLRDDAVDFWFDKRMGGGGQVSSFPLKSFCYATVLRLKTNSQHHLSNYAGMFRGRKEKKDGSDVSYR